MDRRDRATIFFQADITSRCVLKTGWGQSTTGQPLLEQVKGGVKRHRRLLLSIKQQAVCSNFKLIHNALHERVAQVLLFKCAHIVIKARRSYEGVGLVHPCPLFVDAIGLTLNENTCLCYTHNY